MPTKVSILMPVFNGEKYLQEAIESILGQTFVDYEFLIIDDGSADQSFSIIKEFGDSRIKLERNGLNRGLVYSLNKGLDLASGEYIARMDCDDISLPERLAKQVAFMDCHPEVGVCGTWVESMDTGQIYRCLVDHESIQAGLLQTNQMAHPSVMIRTSVIRQHRLYYNPAFPYAEDYELWVRMAKLTRLANLPEVLVRHRIHSLQISNLYQKEQQEIADLISRRQRDQD